MVPNTTSHPECPSCQYPHPHPKERSPKSILQRSTGINVCFQINSNLKGPTMVSDHGSIWIVLDQHSASSVLAPSSSCNTPSCWTSVSGRRLRLARSTEVPSPPGEGRRNTATAKHGDPNGAPRRFHGREGLTGSGESTPEEVPTSEDQNIGLPKALTWETMLWLFFWLPLALSSSYVFSCSLQGQEAHQSTDLVVL